MNTEDMMYDAPVGDYEGMEESVPCCQRPSCVPREAECTGEPGETDLLIADLQQQLERATAKAHALYDISFERYKQIRVLEQRLSEGWWTKLIRWVKNDWEYNIYEDYQR